MLRLTKLSNQYKRRTLRVLYGNTQAYPYGLALSANFDRTAGQLSGGQAVTGSKAAINPGSVAIKLGGEVVTLSGSPEGSATDVAGANLRAFGLFANFVGGELDELNDRADVGVWKGPGSVYEVLAPAFNATSLPANSAEAGDLPANEVYLQAGTDGRLVYNSSAAPGYPATNKAVVRVLDNMSANAIIVELLV